MHEVPGRGRQSGGVGKRRDQPPPDDWLGDISDADWDEGAAERAEQRHATPVRQRPGVQEADIQPAGVVGAPAQARPAAATEARRAGVERRRAIAAVGALLVVGVGAAAAVVVVRDGAEAPATTEPGSVAGATPARTETSATTTASTTPTTTTPTAPNDDLAGFTLPEGTKLQRGESLGDSDLTASTDPELVRELQRALATAGFEPGSPDGVFGQRTEEAVVAFQRANGLPADGIVGPVTADALDSAVAGG